MPRETCTCWQVLFFVVFCCMCTELACTRVKVNVTITGGENLDRGVLASAGSGYEVVEVSESYDMDNVVVDISIVEEGPSHPVSPAPPPGPGANATASQGSPETNLPLIIGCTVGGVIGVLVIVAACVGMQQRPEPPTPRPPPPAGMAWPTMERPSHSTLEVHIRPPTGYEIRREY